LKLSYFLLLSFQVTSAFWQFSPETLWCHTFCWQFLQVSFIQCFKSYAVKNSDRNCPINVRTTS
jgi:hypothetical protein